MPYPARYEYNGKMYTVSELSALSGIHASVLRKRLNSGWTAEEAIAVINESKLKHVEDHLRGKRLWVQFRLPLASVTQQMQPELGKTYMAIPNSEKRSQKQIKDYYVIHLDNGKPLIVYPQEFEVLGVAEGENDGSAAAQYSGKENQAIE